MRITGIEVSVMLTWVVAALGIVLVFVGSIVLWVLLRIRTELRFLRWVVRQQLPILLRIHRVVIGTRALVKRRDEREVVLQPEFAREVPVSPSGQWPSAVSFVGTEFPSEEETSV